MVDNRKHLRINFGFQVRDGSSARVWMTEDISVGGCFLKAIEKIPIGSKINLVFQLPGFSRYIEAVGEVKHVKENGMGIEFVGLGNKEKNVVDRFVQEVHQFSDKPLSGGCPTPWTPLPLDAQR